MVRSFYVLASVGNISFQLSLDTASSDLWLISSDCTTSTCSSIPKYPLTYESSTFGVVNGNLTEFNVSYVDATGTSPLSLHVFCQFFMHFMAMMLCLGASGFVAREEVMLGPVANMSIQNQAFGESVPAIALHSDLLRSSLTNHILREGLVTESNVTFVDDISGILGLGFPRLSTINALAANGVYFLLYPSQFSITTLAAPLLLSCNALGIAIFIPLLYLSALESAYPDECSTDGFS